MRRGIQGGLLFAGGTLLVALTLAWPSFFGGVAAAVVQEAGRGTRTLADEVSARRAAGQDEVADVLARAAGEVRPGPGAAAATPGAAARFVGSALSEAQPVPWLGRPALSAFLDRARRERSAGFVAASGDPAARSWLDSARLPFSQLVPGGRSAAAVPLQALVALGAVLEVGDYFSAELTADWASARDAAAHGDLRRLEDGYLALLGLARRLPLDTLASLLREVDDLAQLRELRNLVQRHPDSADVILAAVLVSGEAGAVLRWLGQRPPSAGASGLAPTVPPLEALTMALRAGDGSLQLLLSRQVPMVRGAEVLAPLGRPFAWLDAAQPGVAWVVKVALALAAAVALAVPLWGGWRGWRSLGILALGAVLLLASEPRLPWPEPVPPPVRLDLGAMAAAVPLPLASSPLPMNSGGLITVAVFLTLQVAVYLFCLRRISEIRRHPGSPLLRLKLLENEDNLFDLGLYIGIAGTALALLVQVLGYVESNLPAAYSSNVMGIVAVALIKIRHVRPLRRDLILAAQEAGELGVVEVKSGRV